MTATTATPSHAAGSPTAPAPRPVSEAPGATTLLAVGRELAAIRKDPVRSLELSSARHGGRPFQLSAPGAHASLFINDPEGAKEVLLTHQDDYEKSSQYEILQRVLGLGLVTSEGELWREHRSIVQPVFAGRAIGAFAQYMVAAASDALDRWDATWTDGQEIDLSVEMSMLTLDIVGRALVGTDFSARSTEFGAALGDMLEAAGAIGRSPVTHISGGIKRMGVGRGMNLQPRRLQRMNAAIDVLDDVILELIERRRRSTDEHDDLLAVLMGYRHPETGEPLSATALRDELMTFVTAGHETTANGLSWMWGLLSQHPSARAQLLTEVDEVLGGDRTPDYDDLRRLEWTTACFQESMRLFPPVWIVQRRAKVDTVAAGYAIPAGTVISISPWVIHRDARNWPNPAGYDPSRFIGDAPKDRPRLAYLPFAAGRRMCIGQGFAMMEATIVTAMLSQRYTFDLVPTARLETDPSITLRPRHGMPVIAHRR
ncbi:MAG: cytochrome P450 [Solirubrobacteraceae bacterium]|nr:cytochrome P450 [Solirubrobacteraceae bacterium]